MANSTSSSSLTTSLHPQKPSSEHAFTPEAGAMFSDKITQYIGDLERYSRASAKRTGDEVVGMKHVESASQYLGTGPNRRFAQHVGTIGGIALGTGFAQMLAMVSDEAYTGLAVIVSMVLIVFGVAGVVYHISKD